MQRLRAHPPPDQPGVGAAVPGDIVRLAALALDANVECELYVISRSADDLDVVRVTEVWTSREAHRASLEDEEIRRLIVQASPLIAGLGDRFELSPVGGKGLPLAG